MKNAGPLLKYLRAQGKSLSPLLILTHNHPDPDAIASAFVLQYLFKSLCGVRARIAYGGIVGRIENQTMVRHLDIPVHPLKPKRDFKRFRHVALVDTQPKFENNAVPEGMFVDLVIDHHPRSCPRPAKRSFIVPEAGATSVILAQALLRLKQPVPRRLATSLSYGILSETQDLGRDTRDLDIRVYKELLPWCDMRSLALIQNPQKSKEFFRVLNRSLDKAFVVGELIGVHLESVDTPDRVSQTADFLLSYEGVRWAVCTGRFQNTLHISLRAIRPKVHAGRLLRQVLRTKIRAGGHRSVAGGSVSFKPPVRKYRWRRAESQVISRLLKQLSYHRSKLTFPFRVG